MSCIQAIFIFSICLGINAVPPEACFANFRWDDCGSPPVRVLYYWKPGSRCEVGVWRGCLPNLNMFQDEYECVATCIFTARAEPEDYHVLGGIEKFNNETFPENETLIDDTTQTTIEDHNTTESTDLTMKTSVDEATELAKENEVDSTDSPVTDEEQKQDTVTKADNDTPTEGDNKNNDITSPDKSEAPEEMHSV